MTPDGRPVEASAAAPLEAICPYCQAVVTLRGRKLMGAGGKTYYWRHQQNSKLQCVKRTRKRG
jgi:hypothetical protein